jgi:hypothetical protein
VGTHTRVHFPLLRGIANIGTGEYTSGWELTTAACATDDKSFVGSDPAIVARGDVTMSGLALGYLERCLLLTVRLRRAVLNYEQRKYGGHAGHSLPTRFTC